MMYIQNNNNSVAEVDKSRMKLDQKRQRCFWVEAEQTMK